MKMTVLEAGMSEGSTVMVIFRLKGGKWWYFVFMPWFL
jgi:hypothetical protein